MAPFDVAVVGASVGGCTAARLFGLAGLRVALVERRPDPAAHKVICTHQILSSAVPTMRRVGIAELIEERGAVRTHPAGWSPFGGWMQLPTDVPHGYGVTRKTLDPLLRKLAADTPGVELITGARAVGLLAAADGRPAGVEVETQGEARRAIGAKLVVGADGRGSDVARMARVPGRVRPHGRFFYFAYWHGLPRTTRARLWFAEPDGVAAFPNEDDLTVVVAGVHKSRLSEFRADPERAYRATIAAVPEAPPLEDAERASKLLGKLDVPNVMRPAAARGLAFVGDAALATDPTMGVGCGWAFQTAEWLVDHTAAALLEGSGLDAALERYRRAFRNRLGLHHWLIADLSTGRRLRANERIAFRAAARDEWVARRIEEVITRRRSPVALLGPVVNARTLAAGLG